MKNDAENYFVFFVNETIVPKRKKLSVRTFHVSNMLSPSFTVAERQAAEEAGRKTGIETVYCSIVPIFD